MGTILVVDCSPHRNEIADIFRECGCRIEISDSAFNAMSKLKAFDFDLVVSEVELPGDNAFDLYNYIYTHYPYIPMIMITGKDIDTFFDHIFQEGIGNVLCKPIDKDELTNLASKLIDRKNIFGLQNYMHEIDEVKRIRVTSSKKIKPSIAAVLEQIETWGFKIDNRIVLDLVLNEMIINAVYHSHGYTSEKEERKQIKLKEGEFVDVFFARNEGIYGIAITDYRGKLSKARILESIHNAIRQSQLIIRAAETGEDLTDVVSETGRGLDMLRKIAGDYYFIIEKDVRTDVIIIFDTLRSDNDAASSSLKIIESA